MLAVLSLETIRAIGLPRLVSTTSSPQQTSSKISDRWAFAYPTL